MLYIQSLFCIVLSVLQVGSVSLTNNTNSSGAPYIAALVVIGLIILQVRSFSSNSKRIDELKTAFTSRKYSVKKDGATGFVNGILDNDGNRNRLFVSILSSINSYLSSNKASVIDFQLIKDTVNRNCDSVEDEINTQTPIPLYMGLIGTMIGIITGLWSFIASGGLSNSSDAAIAEQGFNAGITALLSGVVVAMIASMCGIILTTYSSTKIKKCKEEEESGKNYFLTWIQAEVLPVLSTDTATALGNLATNLNNFNNNFADNTKNLRATLDKINETYTLQEKEMEAIAKLDVKKIASFNVNVLKQSEDFISKFASFNKDLDAVKDFTSDIKVCSKQLATIGETLSENLSSQLNKSVTDVDDSMHKTLNELYTSTEKQIDVTQKSLTTMLDSNKTFVESINNGLLSNYSKGVEESIQVFQKSTHDMQNSFSEQIKAMPIMSEKIEDLSTMSSKMNDSFKMMSSGFNDSFDRLIKSIEEQVTKALRAGVINAPALAGNTSTKYSGSPKWIKMTFLVSSVIIALFCLLQIFVWVNDKFGLFVF
jgi:hypothetical protein